jgi:ascorbate-specific PTS system EIIC-type component UlaA
MITFLNVAVILFVCILRHTQGLNRSLRRPFISTKRAEQSREDMTLVAKQPSVPIRPDLESLRWVVGGQAVLAGVGMLIANLVQACQAPSVVPLHASLNLNDIPLVLIYVAPIVVGGFMFSHTPGAFFKNSIRDSKVLALQLFGANVSSGAGFRRASSFWEWDAPQL